MFKFLQYLTLCFIILPTYSLANDYGLDVTNTTKNISNQLINMPIANEGVSLPSYIEHHQLGFHRILGNGILNIKSFWEFIFFLAPFFGLFACYYGVMKYREAGIQDSEVQKNALTRKGMMGMIGGLILLSLSAFIIITTDSIGVTGTVVSGSEDLGMRLGMDKMDGHGICGDVSKQQNAHLNESNCSFGTGFKY